MPRVRIAFRNNCHSCAAPSLRITVGTFRGSYFRTLHANLLTMFKPSIYCLTFVPFRVAAGALFWAHERIAWDPRSHFSCGVGKVESGNMMGQEKAGYADDANPRLVLRFRKGLCACESGIRFLLLFLAAGTALHAETPFYTQNYWTGGWTSNFTANWTV